MKNLIIIAIVFSGMLFMASCQKSDSINPSDKVKYVKSVEIKYNDGDIWLTEYFYDTDWSIMKIERNSVTEAGYTTTIVFSRTGNSVIEDINHIIPNDSYHSKNDYRYYSDRIETYNINPYNNDTSASSVYLINSSNKIYSETQNYNNQGSRTNHNFIWKDGNVGEVETFDYFHDTVWTWEIEYYKDVINPFKVLSPFFASVDIQGYSLWGDNFPKKDDWWDTYTILTKEGDYPKSFMWSDGTIAELTYY